MAREKPLVNCPEWRLAWEMFHDLVRAGVIHPQSHKTLTGNEIGELHMASHGRVPGVRHLHEIVDGMYGPRPSNHRS
jgi:hypothetical protein